MRPTVLTLLLLGLMASAGIAADPPRRRVEESASPDVKVGLDSEGHLILQDAQRHLIELSATLGPTLDTELRLLAYWRAPEHQYLLVTLSSRSAANPMGYCGAGTETNLTWMALSTGYRLEAVKQVLIESCLDDVESEPFAEACGQAVAAGKECVVDNGALHTQTSVSIERSRPEQGLVLREAPLPEEP